MERNEHSAFEWDVDKELLGWQLPRSAVEIPSASVVAKRLSQSHPDWKTLRRLVGFRAGGYHREVVLRTPACELVVAAWLPGQRSAIHDHGGSFGASLVVIGELHETRYLLQEDGNVRSIAFSVAPPGTVLVETQTTIHCMENLSDAPALSVHLYAPPGAVPQTWRLG